MIFTFLWRLVEVACYVIAALCLAAAVKVLIDGWRRMNDGQHKAGRATFRPERLGDAKHALRAATWHAAPTNLPGPAHGAQGDPATALKRADETRRAGEPYPLVNEQVHRYAAEAISQQATWTAARHAHMTAVAQAVRKARTIDRQPAPWTHAGDNARQGCWPMADRADFTESAWTKRSAADLAIQLARAETDAGFDAIRPREICEYAFSGILPRWPVTA